MSYTDGNFSLVGFHHYVNDSTGSWFIELGYRGNSDFKLTSNVDTDCLHECEDDGYDEFYCEQRCKILEEDDDNDTNERVLSKAEVFAGTVVFSTFTPSDNPCGGGDLRVYALDYMSGNATNVMQAGVVSGTYDTPDSTRSVLIEEGSGVPSPVKVYSGGSGGGERSFALVTEAGGGTKAIPMQFNVGELLNIIYWREVR